MGLDRRFVFAIGWAALAAWSPALASAGGVDTTGTGSDSTGTESTGTESTGTESTGAESTGSESTGSEFTGTSESSSTSTDDVGESEGEVETGPCLTIDSCLSTCACETTGDDPHEAAALGLVPLLAIRRRKRSELVDRFRREARLPADVLARLCTDDED